MDGNSPEQNDQQPEGPKIPQQLDKVGAADSLPSPLREEPPPPTTEDIPGEGGVGVLESPTGRPGDKAEGIEDDDGDEGKTTLPGQLGAATSLDAQPSEHIDEVVADAPTDKDLGLESNEPAAGEEPASVPPVPRTAEHDDVEDPQVDTGNNDEDAHLVPPQGRTPLDERPAAEVDQVAATTRPTDQDAAREVSNIFDETPEAGVPSQREAGKDEQIEIVNPVPRQGEPSEPKTETTPNYAGRLIDTAGTGKYQTDGSEAQEVEEQSLPPQDGEETTETTPATKDEQPAEEAPAPRPDFLGSLRDKLMHAFNAGVGPKPAEKPDDTQTEPPPSSRKNEKNGPTEPPPTQ